MLKLAQRAYEYSDSKYPINDIANKEECHINWVATRSYILGAQTQHKIDIEKACQWLSNYFVIKHEAMLAQGCDAFLKEFRKTMEE